MNGVKTKEGNKFSLNKSPLNLNIPVKRKNTMYKTFITILNKHKSTKTSKNNIKYRHCCPSADHSEIGRPKNLMSLSCLVAILIGPLWWLL